MIDGLRRRLVHAGDSRELLDAGRLDFRDAAERAPERLATRGADADDMIEDGDEVALAAQLAVVSDGKAVRFIADALDEIERLT